MLKRWLRDPKVIDVVSYNLKTGDLSFHEPRFRIKVFFAWYDCWIGAYYDRKNYTLYVCPFFMVVFKFYYG